MVIIGLLNFYPLTHQKLLTKPTQLSGPFPSKEPWFTVIYNLVRSTRAGQVIFDWILTNSALLHPLNIVFVVLIIYNWQRVSLFQTYIQDKEKVRFCIIIKRFYTQEVEYTVNDLEFKYIKAKNMLIKTKL